MLVESVCVRRVSSMRQLKDTEVNMVHAPENTSEQPASIISNLRTKSAATAHHYGQLSVQCQARTGECVSPNQ